MIIASTVGSRRLWTFWTWALSSGAAIHGALASLLKANKLLNHTKTYVGQDRKFWTTGNFEVSLIKFEYPHYLQEQFESSGKSKSGYGQSFVMDASGLDQWHPKWNGYSKTNKKIRAASDFFRIWTFPSSKILQPCVDSVLDYYVEDNVCGERTVPQHHSLTIGYRHVECSTNTANQKSSFDFVCVVTTDWARWNHSDIESQTPLKDRETFLWATAAIHS